MTVRRAFFQLSNQSSIRKWRGLIAVLGAFLVHLTLGNFFTLGNLSPYMMSYLRNRVDSTVTMSNAIWINALSYTGQGTLMVLGGYMERKIGARLTCLIGSIIFCGSIALSSLAIKNGFIALALTYGLSSCLGLSFGYISVLALGMKWFPERKGLINGIILAGYGLGALVFNPVQTALVNPDNIRINATDGYFSDPMILDRVPYLFLYMSVIYASIQAFSICLLFPCPKENLKPQVYLVQVKDLDISKIAGEPKYSINTDNNPAVVVPTEGGHLIQTLKDFHSWQMLRHKEFYMLWLAFALHAQSIQFINTYYKIFGEKFIHDDHFLSTVGSVAAIFNCLGRIFWGQLHDKSNYKLCMLILSACFTTLMGTFPLVHYGGRAMFTVWVLATFFTFSGIFSLMPTAASQAFGQKYAGPNFGVLFTAPALMAVCGAPFIQFLLLKVDFKGTFLTLAGMNALAFIVTLFVPWKMETVRMKMQ